MLESNICKVIDKFKCRSNIDGVYNAKNLIEKELTKNKIEVCEQSEISNKNLETINETQSINVNQSITAKIEFTKLHKQNNKNLNINVEY